MEPILKNCDEPNLKKNCRPRITRISRIVPSRSEVIRVIRGPQFVVAVVVAVAVAVAVVVAAGVS